MTTRVSRKNNQLAVKSAELAMAVPQVVAHRVARMALSGSSPTARDIKEFDRMSQEKMSAFMESWSSMTFQTWRVYQQVAFSAFQSFWYPIFGLRKPRQSTSSLMNNALPNILMKGMLPVHRRAVANAKRLSHTSFN